MKSKNTYLTHKSPAWERDIETKSVCSLPNPSSESRGVILG